MITHTPVGCPHTPLGHQLTGNQLTTRYQLTTRLHRRASVARRWRSVAADPYRQAARPGGGRPGRLDATAQPRSPSMPLRPQYSLAMTRSSGWQCEGYRQTHTGTTTSRAVAHHHVARQQVMTRGVIRKGQTLLALENRGRVRAG